MSVEPKEPNRDDEIGDPEESTAADADRTIADPSAANRAVPAPKPSSNDVFAMPRLIDKRYQVEGLIGSGGMGAVYRAINLETKQTVAIKRLSQGQRFEDTTVGDTTIGRFRREFIVMQRLRHPNIVEVRDFGWLDTGEPYLVMEYVTGHTLSTVLRQRMAARPLPRTSASPPSGPELECIVRVWLQLCEALDFIHQNGMVHRDVKPANIMLEGNPFTDEQFTLKLMDFGLARLTDDSQGFTQAGSMIGTATYISPEQALGTTNDLRTDLYSMGVIMYEMATGIPPFVAETPLAIVRMHTEANPLVPMFINPALPDYINAIILNLLSKAPEQRISAASDVAQLLRAKQAPERIESKARTPSSTLVGRDKVIDQLEDICMRAWSGNKVQCAVIFGDVGIGKTALLTEMNLRAKRHNATLLRGVGSETGRMPYGAVAEALSSYLSRRKLDDQREELLRDIRFELARIIPELAAPSNRVLPVEDINPSQSQVRLFTAVSQLVARIAQRKPMLWMIDDAQWLGNDDDVNQVPDALELLAYILRRNIEAPLCVLIAARPAPALPVEVLEHAIGRDNVHTMTLGALDEASARKLAESSLGRNISTNAVSFIVDRTDGNPLFIQELANTLRAERPTPEQIASVTESISLPVPVRIARVVANRLADVDEMQRKILDWAAVYGREFDLEVLASAMSQSADDVANIVDTLLKRQVLQERRSPRTESYRFTHQQLREVLYGELSARRKRSMHNAVGGALERTTTALPADLAYHFGESGDDGKAITYGLLAGDRARDAYANQDAIKFYQRVLDRASNRRDYAEHIANAQFGLGEIHFFLGKFAAAREAFGRVLELTA
jgi:serine/threonine protein kinase